MKREKERERDSLFFRPVSAGSLLFFSLLLVETRTTCLLVCFYLSGVRSCECGNKGKKKEASCFFNLILDSDNRSTGAKKVLQHPMREKIKIEKK